MHTIILLSLAFLGLAPEPLPTAPTEPVAVLSCGAPLCIYDDGTPVTGPCRAECGPWVPGAANVCDVWTCEFLEPASSCMWHCKPS
jgi:hypothetical protein